MKKVIAYYRVSTSKQGEAGLGIESQKSIVHTYAAGHSMEIAGEFVEVESGSKTDKDRPQLAASLALCRKWGATLIVAKLDRLSRNAGFLLTLQASNLDFVCCDCPNVDRFTVGILALVAQRERELIAERTKSALAIARANGVKLGTKTPEKQVELMAVASRKNAQEFRNKVMPIIEGIKKTGVSTLQEIADCLTRRGILTKHGKRTWHPASVRAVMIAV